MNDGIVWSDIPQKVFSVEENNFATSKRQVGLRVNSMLVQCLFRHDAWNPMGTMLPEPDPRCCVYFAPKGNQCPSKLISPQLAWTLGRNMAKRTCTNLNHGECDQSLWPRNKLKASWHHFFGRCYATSCFLHLHTWLVLRNIMFLAWSQSSKFLELEQWFQLALRMKIRHR